MNDYNFPSWENSIFRAWEVVSVHYFRFGPISEGWAKQTAPFCCILVALCRLQIFRLAQAYKVV